MEWFLRARERWAERVRRGDGGLSLGPEAGGDRLGAVGGGAAYVGVR